MTVRRVGAGDVVIAALGAALLWAERASCQTLRLRRASCLAGDFQEAPAVVRRDEVRPTRRDSYRTRSKLVL